MTNDDVLALFDEEMRRKPAIADPRYRFELAGRVARILGPTHESYDNCVIFSAFQPGQTDRIVVEQITYFEDRRRGFEWKVLDHDKPDNLPRRLVDYGFQPGEAETLHVLPTDAVPRFRAPAAGIAVQRIEDEARLPDVAAVHTQVWRDDRGWLVEELARDLAERPQAIAVFVACDAENPVGTLWARFAPSGVFASVWGAAVVPEAPEAAVLGGLVTAVTRAAAERGVRFLAITTPTAAGSALTRHGFRAVSRIRNFAWRQPGLRR